MPKKAHLKPPRRHNFSVFSHANNKQESSISGTDDKAAFKIGRAKCMADEVELEQSLDVAHRPWCSGAGADPLLPGLTPTVPTPGQRAPLGVLPSTASQRAPGAGGGWGQRGLSHPPCLLLNPSSAAPHRSGDVSSGHFGWCAHPGAASSRAAQSSHVQ